MTDQFEQPQSGPQIGERLGLATSKPKRRIKKWMWWTGGIGLGLVVLVLLISRGGPAPNYEFQPVSKGKLTLTVSATGNLAPRVEVEVGAEVSGRIDDLYVDYNDPVVKGQKLAQINTDQIEAQLDQARATLAQQQATLTQTSAKYQRYAALIRTHDISQQDYDNAKADHLRAQASVAQYGANVKQYETQLEKATIYAPMDGVILDRKVSKGQTVVASFNTPVLFTMASDLKQMQLDVDIDEADVGTVHAGQKAEFTVGAYPDEKFSAHLIKVHTASETVQNVVTYKGELLVDNTKLLLKPGMTATAEIVTGTLPESILVPNAALRFIPPANQTAGIAAAKTGAGLGRVWTVENGKLKPHDLRLGGTDGRTTQVMQGDLKPGDRVITDAKIPGNP